MIGYQKEQLFTKLFCGAKITGQKITDVHAVSPTRSRLKKNFAVKR